MQMQQDQKGSNNGHICSLPVHLGNRAHTGERLMKYKSGDAYIYNLHKAAQTRSREEYARREPPSPVMLAIWARQRKKPTRYVPDFKVGG